MHVSLIESQVAWLANQASNHLVGGLNPTRMGNAHPNIVPYRVYQASDGSFVLACANDGLWRRFCAVTNRDDLAADERFATNAGRVRYRADLEPLLDALFSGRNRADWIELLSGGGIPCGPINTVAEVFADEQVRALGMVANVEHPTIGSVPQVRSPISLEGSPLPIRTPPPLLGQHTAEILEELGYSGEEVATLTANRKGS